MNREFAFQLFSSKMIHKNTIAHEHLSLCLLLVDQATNQPVNKHIKRLESELSLEMNGFGENIPCSKVTWAKHSGKKLK